MKRFLTLCLFAIIYLLCGQFGYAQSNPSSPQETVESSSAVEEQMPTGTDNVEPKIEERHKGTENIVPVDTSLLDERMAEIAQEANNFAKIQMWLAGGSLTLLFFATLFAFGAWWESKKGVKITKQATKAEYQPYIISLNDSFNISRYIPDKSNTVINFVGDFEIKNVGRTPASNIHVAANIKYKGKNYGENRVFDIQGAITNWRFDDLHPDEWRTFKLNFELDFPNGDAQDFLKIREMDIWIKVTFDDLFCQTRRQVMHFLIEEMATGAHLQGSKEEK